VILTVRDSPDAWVKSVSETIATAGKLMKRRPMKWIVPGFANIDYNIWKRSGNILFDANGDIDKASASKAYQEWIEQVKAEIPPQQLLVHNAKQGWPPLCDFLNLQGDKCPSNRGEKYPHVNDSAGMKRNFAILGFIVEYFDLFVGFLLGVILTAFLNYLRKRNMAQSVKSKSN
jgi:hypothetical protein